MTTGTLSRTRADAPIKTVARIGGARFAGRHGGYSGSAAGSYQATARAFDKASKLASNISFSILEDENRREQADAIEMGIRAGQNIVQGNDNTDEARSFISEDAERKYKSAVEQGIRSGLSLRLDKALFDAEERSEGDPEKLGDELAKMRADVKSGLPESIGNDIDTFFDKANLEMRKGAYKKRREQVMAASRSQLMMGLEQTVDEIDEFARNGKLTQAVLMRQTAEAEIMSGLDNGSVSSPAEAANLIEALHSAQNDGEFVSEYQTAVRSGGLNAGARFLARSAEADSSGRNRRAIARAHALHRQSEANVVARQKADIKQAETLMRLEDAGLPVDQDQKRALMSRVAGTPIAAEIEIRNEIRGQLQAYTSASTDERARMRDALNGKVLGLDDQVPADVSIALSGFFDRADVASDIDTASQIRDFSAATNALDRLETSLDERLGGNRDAIKSAKQQIKDERDRLREVDTQIGEATDALLKVKASGKEVDLEEEREIRALAAGSRHGAKIELFDRHSQIAFELQDASDAEREAVLSSLANSVVSIKNADQVLALENAMQEMNSEIEEAEKSGTRLDQYVQIHRAQTKQSPISPIGDFFDAQTWASRGVEIDAIRQKIGGDGVKVLTNTEVSAFAEVIENSDPASMLSSISDLKASLTPDQWSTVMEGVEQTPSGSAVKHAVRIVQADTARLPEALNVLTILNTPIDDFGKDQIRDSAIKKEMKQRGGPVASVLRSQAQLLGQEQMFKMASKADADTIHLATGLATAVGASEGLDEASDLLWGDMQSIDDSRAVITLDRSFGDIGKVLDNLESMRELMVRNADVTAATSDDEADDLRDVWRDRALWVNVPGGFTLVDPMTKKRIKLERGGNSVIGAGEVR